jgi:hypothetical protein
MNQQSNETRNVRELLERDSVRREGRTNVAEFGDPTGIARLTVHECVQLGAVVLKDYERKD